MTTFLQLQLLTAYPPSNPNRDDTGRPKEARVGGVPRLRLSSQSIKHAVRMSELFTEALKGHLGDRTKLVGKRLFEHLVRKGATEDVARKISADVTLAFGATERKSKDGQGDYTLSQLAFISPEEKAFVFGLADKALAGEKLPTGKELAATVLRSADGAVDIAMFGRMLADEDTHKRARFEREAAVQVGHAITTHRAISETDYFTAVDGLRELNDPSGAAHLGEHGFGSGVYYLYVCVDCNLLIENLNGDKALARKGMEALVQALATTTPKGKQNSHAHHPMAMYVRAECGSDQPRDLTGSFFKPITGENQIENSIEALESMAAKIDRAYGLEDLSKEVMNVVAGIGSLKDIIAFAGNAVEKAGGKVDA